MVVGALALVRCIMDVPRACRLVSQKGRRFAFCNFASVEDAVAAKASLSRSEVWRYNVSFAKVITVALSSSHVCPA